MSNFSFLSVYVINESGDKNIDNDFHPLTVEDVKQAENRLGYTLPIELKELYSQIGYGFMNKGNGAFNRLVDPFSLVQIALKEDFYEGDPDLEVYDDLYNDDKLLFFEVNEGIYLAIDKEDEAGKNKIYYFDKKIFDSLEDFMKEFLNDPDLIRNLEV